MPRRRKNGAANAAVAELESEIGQLMNDLEARLERLNGMTKTSTAKATGEIEEFVNATVSHLSDRFTGQLRNGTHALGNEAKDMGSDALKRIVDEIEHRPLLTIVVAAGIGFIAGLARR